MGYGTNVVTDQDKKKKIMVYTSVAIYIFIVFFYIYLTEAIFIVTDRMLLKMMNLMKSVVYWSYIMRMQLMPIVHQVYDR